MINKNFISINDKTTNQINFYIDFINEALDQGFRNIKPENIVKNSIQRKGKFLLINNIPIDLKEKHLYVIGAGKATYETVDFLIPLIKDQYKSGIINIPKSYYKEDLHLPNTRIELTSHPIPDEATFISSQKHLSLLTSLTEKDIVFVVITGGASSLFEVPIANIPFKDIIATYRQLLVSGLSIQQINIIRKHLSQIKGGKLVDKTNAQVIGLLISDVPGDDISAIGSGPTIADDSTFQDCLTILQENNLLKKLPNSVKEFFITQLNDESNSHNSSDRHTSNAKNFVLCSNNTILNAIQNNLINHGIETTICTNKFSGEAQDISSFLIKYIQFPYFGIPRCFLFGGESVVTISDQILANSHGGRNQELILSFVIEYIEKNLNTSVLVLSIGTDGIDGNSTNAGAVFCNDLHSQLLSPVQILKDQLAKHNSADCLPANCYLVTGPTGTNVGDIIILFLY